MNKKEHIYKKILENHVVNKNDLQHISKELLDQKDTQYLYRKYLYNLEKEKKVGKIKRGLYYSIPLQIEQNDFKVDRYILANKIYQGYALGYHSALELHGAAHSSFNTIYVLVTKNNRFQSFDFQNVSYKPIINNHSKKNLQFKSYKNTIINITNSARTFIECLDRTELCGGWEECLKSLANLKGVELDNIKQILNMYNNKTLTLKTGYILELLSKKSPYFSHIDKKELEPLRATKDWIPVYLDRTVKSSFNKRWGLYLPEGLAELLRGI